jgi:hypothetical protein
MDMSQLNADSPQPDADRPAQPHALQRRVALLKGLRAGGVAAAGVVSLNSHAARVVGPNGKQCTFSAQVSAAVSNSATMSAAPCGGYAPGSLYQSDPANLSVSKTSETSINAPGLKLSVADTYVIVQTTGNGAAPSDPVRLTAKGWPSLGVLPGRATMANLFGGTDGSPLLYVLSLRNDLSYFVAGYFSAALSLQPASMSHVPFTTDDVVRYYNGGNPRPEAVSFLRMVCVA